MAHSAAKTEIVVPGAMMSGLMRPSSVGPMELKNARLSKRSAHTSHGQSRSLGPCTERFERYMKHQRTLELFRACINAQTAFSQGGLQCITAPISTLSERAAHASNER